MARRDAWRLQYRNDRYARHLSPPELNQRFRDILLNMLRLTEDSKIGLREMDIPPDVVGNESSIWMEKGTHIMEEMSLPVRPLPGRIYKRYSAQRADFASDLAQKAVKRLAMSGATAKDALIKFGKRKYKEQLYEEGGLRIQPATFFAETYHNEAIRDDELTHTLSLVLSRDDVIKLVTNPQDVPPNIPDQRANVTMKWPSDYWLYCVSSAMEARLFVDYNADSCVIIKDREKFVQLLGDAGTRALSGIPMRYGPADYVDPLLPKTHNIFVPFAKHFKYTYQNEYRFCWLPPKIIPKLQHVDVQIGSLKDFSELIVL